MTTLRIAFCGPNMVLNENLAIHAKDLVYREGLDIIPVGNPLHQLAQITQRQDWAGKDLDWMNLWAADLRRMMLEGVRDQDVLISSSGGLDQVALQAAWVGEQMAQQQSGLVGPDGKPMVTQEQVMSLNRSGASLQIIINSTEYEVMEVFDFTYCVLPVGLGNVPPEVEALLSQYQDFLNDIPAFKERIVRLPDNEDAAKDAIEKESEKWRKRLDS